ncbi:hypothetical protein C8R44DRAFT_767188, partial [Mycena epipterygia]
MTSPRLRHSSSAARLGVGRSPLEGLGLRVAMPAYVAPHQVQEGAGAVMPRQRTVSGVYMLGLGVGSRRPSGLGMPPRGIGAGGKAGGEESDV